DSMGLQRPSGALVASVVSGGPAEKAGLKSGDLVVSIDGASVDDPNAFGYRFATKPLGGTAQLGILRQGRSMTLPIALQRLPEPPGWHVHIKAASLFGGAGVGTWSPPRADEPRLDAQTGGVVITAVADGSAAQSVGFQKGDVVVTVNNEKINRSADLERVTSAGGRQWRITILRGGQQISVMFSG